MTIPTCHHCHSSALPFALSPSGAQWQHSCGAIVCPACGGVPMAGDHLCGLCRQVAGAPRPGSIQLGASDVARVARGRPRHGR